MAASPGSTQPFSSGNRHGEIQQPQWVTHVTAAELEATEWSQTEATLQTVTNGPEQTSNPRGLSAPSQRGPHTERSAGADGLDQRSGQSANSFE